MRALGDQGEASNDRIIRRPLRKERGTKTEQ